MRICWPAPPPPGNSMQSGCWLRGAVVVLLPALLLQLLLILTNNFNSAEASVPRHAACSSAHRAALTVITHFSTTVSGIITPTTLPPPHGCLHGNCLSATEQVTGGRTPRLPIGPGVGSSRRRRNRPNGTGPQARPTLLSTTHAFANLPDARYGKRSPPKKTFFGGARGC